MQKRLFPLLCIALFLPALSAVGQRRELSLSPVGLVYPKSQLVQYERYLGRRQSWTASFGHNSSVRSQSLLMPPRTDRFWTTRGVIGFRQYFDIIDGYEGIIFFGSVRAIVDYSVLRLKSDARYAVSPDSLRAAGFSVGPELLLGGKVTFARRVTLSGAAGAQYLLKLFPTDQITRNQAYWDGAYWANDNFDWQYKRNVAINHRRGWYPSIFVTIGVILGKERPLHAE